MTHHRKNPAHRNNYMLLLNIAIVWLSWFFTWPYFESHYNIAIAHTVLCTVFGNYIETKMQLQYTSCTPIWLYTGVKRKFV